MAQRDATTVSFRVLLGLVAAVILAEIFFLWFVPYAVARYKAQLQRAETIQGDFDLVLREHESLRMIPPVVGVRYRLTIDPQSQKLFAELRGLDNAERLRLLQQRKVSEEAFLGVLDHCFDGGASERRLEEFLVQAIARQELPYSNNAVYVRLSHNYYRTAERSQYAGFIDDAQRSYRRFIELVRILNTDSAIGVKVHRALNRASVRLKTLAPEHAFATETMRKAQGGPAVVTSSLVTHSDARIAALARFNAASFLWHAHGDTEGAVRLLDGNLPGCGALATECKFLLAKILNSLADANRSRDEPVPMLPVQQAHAQKARTLLDELIRDLPDRDPLLDDVYFHRALVAEYRRDVPGARAELRELRRRSPNTDLVSDMKALEESLSADPAALVPRS